MRRRTPLPAPLVAAGLVLCGSVAQAQLVPLDELAESRREAWPVKTSVIAQYTALVVTDDDPANDRSIQYLLRARGKVFPGGTAVLGIGLNQRFVAEEDDSSLRLSDTLIGFEWATPVKLSEEKTLSLTHVLWGFLPTSRASSERDLIFAPVWQLRAAMEVLPGLSVGAVPYFRYRFHRYAERAGPTGELNTQLDFGVRGGLDYDLISSKRFGSWSAGLSMGTAYARAYDARDPTGQDPWSQAYDWEVHTFYNPLPFLLMGLTLQQGAPLLRGGVANAVLFHRDETEWAATLGVTL